MIGPILITHNFLPLIQKDAEEVVAISVGAAGIDVVLVAKLTDLNVAIFAGHSAIRS